MNSTPGFGDSYYKHSSRSESLHSPSSPAHTSYSYDQPQISGEVILEEIPAAISRPGSSLNQSKRKEPAPNVSFSKGGGSPTQPRRWRLIPATCTCPVHSSSQDYSVGNSSSFVSDEDSFRFSRYSSSRSRVLDEELDRLKGTVHQLENDVMQNKGPRRLSPKSSTLPAPSRSSFRERTEIESTRKELESELKGWHGKLLEQMEGLKKRLGEEMSTRSSHEHELLTKNSHIERLQHQLEDAMKKLHIADEKIIDLKTSKSKLKDKLGDAVAELRDIPQKRAADESKFSDEMRRILENEMDVRIKVETELHNLQKLVEKEMGESANVKKLLEARTRELEETRNANSRLERDLHMLKNSVEKEKSHYSREVDQRELDCQELRDQLNLVTNQLEKEREHHLEQMREKIQELNNLQQELQRLKKRVAELESMLEKASQKNQQLDGDRSKIAELESVKTRLETEISQLQNKLRTVDKDRERMVAAIYDLQSQVDNLQNRSDSPDQEHNRAATMIRELQAQVEDLRIKYAEEHEHSSKLVGEVDETNLALDEVRLGLEKEMELKKEAERENGVLQRMFEDEVNQWRAREAEWEAERAELKDSNVNSFEYLTKIEKLEKAVEQLEQDLEDRNRELEEREAIIDELRENGARDSDKEEDKPKTDFEERMKMQVEGFQEQVKDLCIQLEEAHQKLDKESKAKADVETSKRRLEKALLELNAKLQATPTKASRDAEAQITSLKDQLAQVEDELNRSRAESRDDIEDFEFDPDLMEYDDEEIIESDEKVRVKLTDIQRVLRQLHKSLHQEQESTRRAREAEDANEEYHEWPNGHTGEQPEEEEGEGETIEDEDEEEQVPEELKEEPEEDEEQEPEQEEGLEQEEQEQEQEPEPEPEQEEGLEQEEATLGEPGQGELELEPLEAPLTPNGSKHVHFFGTPSPPATPPQTSPLQSPKTPSYPTSPTSPRSPRLPANEAEKERLANEWQRKVASSANKYTSSRIPLSSTKRLFSDSNKSSNENLKTKFEGLKKLVDSTPGEPKQPSTPSGKAPGFYYVPTQSDEIDEKLSKLVEQSDSSALGNIPTNFSRLEEGVYQFGTKKLHMCIRNGALVVRVGGGYMLFVDYLANDKYAKAENVRFRREGMSFTKKSESVSKPPKKRNPQEKSQNITTPSKWAQSSEVEQS